MFKHEHLIGFLTFQESQLFHPANSNIGKRFSPRNNNRSPYPFSDPCFDAFTYFAAGGKDGPIVTSRDRHPIFKTYEQFIEDTEDLSSKEKSLAYDYFEDRVKNAMRNNDHKELGSSNPDVIESYRELRHYPYGSISETGPKIYNELINDSEDWRAVREGRLIYMVNKTDDKLMFFIDMYWGDALDIALEHEIDNIGFTRDMSEVAWMDVSKIIEMGRESFEQLGQEISDVLHRVNEQKRMDCELNTSI